MSSGSGFQRVVQLFWDKDLENTDHENPIVVLGNIYSFKQDSPREDDQSDTSAETRPNETPEKAHQADISISEFKNYFQSFGITGNNTPSIKKEKESNIWPQEFIDDVYTRIWLTYRTKFAPINRDEDGPSPISLHNLIRGQNYDLNSEYFTTDCGWGCMIRTGQTLLANALLNLHLGRQWRFSEEANEKHEQIVSWFIDCPSHPFSIHRIVDKGRILSNKKAGEWFGPSAAARSIQALCNDFDSGLTVYIGSDSGDIYENDVFKVAKDDTGVFQPVLILLGVRLGVESINKLYWNSLKSILQSSESVGISGGRPSSSHYFFGFQGDYLFYLDPHFPQQALLHEDKLENSVSESTEIVSSLDIQSVHTKKLRKIHLSEVDPSMLLGFLIKDEHEWLDWKQKIQDAENKNSVVRISPDHTPRDFSKRKPSFVVYDKNGDDFVDVGLEYEDLPEDEEFEQVDESQAVADPLAQIGQNQTSSVEISNCIDPSGTIANGSVIILPREIETKTPLNTEEQKAIAGSFDTTTESFENYSTSIKDDYENIGTSSVGVVGNISEETVDDMTSVKADEEPYVVQNSEIDSSSPATVSETVFQEDWESSS